MPQGMKRTDLQAIAQSKIDDAVLLLQDQRYSNSYYLAGFAVEIALKACIAKQIAAETIPDKTFIQAIHVHNIAALVGLAGLKPELQNKEDSDPDFHTYWGIATKWGPSARYQAIDSLSCQLLIQAVIEPDHGVLPWIKTYW